MFLTKFRNNSRILMAEFDLGLPGKIPILLMLFYKGHPFRGLFRNNTNDYIIRTKDLCKIYGIEIHTLGSGT